MRKPLFCILLLLSFSFAHAQESDEFEITEPAFEINESQDSLNPDNNSASEEVPNIVPVDDQAFDLSTPATPAQNNEDEVIVRTREEELRLIGNGNPGDYVEVRAPRDVFLPYKQRQSDWGFFFSLGSEQTFFPNLLTQVGIANGDDFTFEEMFGKKGISMMSIEMGPKYNTSAGSIALLFGYGTLSKKDGRITNLLGSGPSISEISFTRYSVTAIYYLDMIFSEPYFVPYVGGGVWQADYREKSTSYPDETAKHTTKPGTQYRFGALFGLDWIEEDAARVARKRNGTQGAFLNVYASSTMMAESDPDPDFTTNMDIGASVIVEF